LPLLVRSSVFYFFLICLGEQVFLPFFAPLPEREILDYLAYWYNCTRRGHQKPENITPVSVDNCMGSAEIFFRLLMTSQSMVCEFEFSRHSPQKPARLKSGDTSTVVIIPREQITIFSLVDPSNPIISIGLMYQYLGVRLLSPCTCTSTVPVPVM